MSAKTPGSSSSCLCPAKLWTRLLLLLTLCYLCQVVAASVGWTYEELQFAAPPGPRLRRFSQKKRMPADLYNESNPVSRKVLVLSVAHDHYSWGEKGLPGRNFYDYLGVVANFTHPQVKLSLGILISSQQEYDAVSCALLLLYAPQALASPAKCSQTPKPSAEQQLALQELQLRRLVLVNGSAADPTVFGRVNRELHRHDDRVQRERRRALSRYRNILLSVALWDEYAVVWLDSDLQIVPHDMLPTMLSSGLDIICPPTYMTRPDNVVYDWNVWKGPIGPLNKSEIALVAAGGYINKLHYPRGKPQFLDAISAANPSQFVEIDSVGATVLYVRADIHRQGVIFPPGYIVGADWNTTEGFDGIESEGLCFLANMMGYRCWGMPHMRVYHVPDY